MRPTLIFSSLLTICLVLLSGCNLPTVTASPPNAGPSGSAAPSGSESPGGGLNAPEASETPAASAHKMKPAKADRSEPVYDSEAHTTAKLKYAANGDLYDLNRFERPFTKDMTYLPYLDIQSFFMSKDANWYYASVQIEDLSSKPEQGLEPMYGIEIDYDNDGRGDYLIWAKAPFSNEWDTSSVTVYTDPNHSVGGPHPEKADPSDKAGDGYEKIIFDHGRGDDPDLAWVQISPDDPNIIEFAFKKTLIPEGFLEWAAWADAGLKDPTQFAYNDRMSKKDAGSPIKNDPDYPLKGLYAVDSTCYNPYGQAVSSGYLPLLCPFEITPTRRPHVGPSPIPPTPTPVIIP